jgi:hypothetical protein
VCDRTHIHSVLSVENINAGVSVSEQCDHRSVMPCGVSRLAVACVCVCGLRVCASVGVGFASGLSAPSV